MSGDGHAGALPAGHGMLAGKEDYAIVSRTHETLRDERNARILICFNGSFVPTKEAEMSVFDSGYVVGVAYGTAFD